MLVVSASRRLRKAGKEDLDFEASLDYVNRDTVSAPKQVTVKQSISSPRKLSILEINFSRN